MAQRFTDLDVAVIRGAQRRRRRVLVPRADENWLRELSSQPARQLLWEMAQRGALLPAGRGRYAIVERLGTDHLDQAAPWQVLLHGLMEPYGEYYLGYLSAIVEHHLTDLESPTIYVAIRGRNRGLKGEFEVLERLIVPTFIVEPKWHEDELETVTLSRTERYRRSNLHRTLVDCLDRPHLCGSPELYVTAWQRALTDPGLDIEKLCRYALHRSKSVAQRTGLLLTLSGHEKQAKRHLRAVFARKTIVAFDPRAHVAREGKEEIDRDWGVRLTVPRDVLEGWLLAWKS